MIQTRGFFNFVLSICSTPYKKTRDATGVYQITKLRTNKITSPCLNTKTNVQKANSYYFLVLRLCFSLLKLSNYSGKDGLKRFNFEFFFN